MAQRGMAQRGMARRGMNTLRGLAGWAAVLAAGVGMGSPVWAAEPTPAAQAGFDAYAQRVEARLAQERGQQAGQTGTILAPVDWRRAQAGEVVVEELTPRGNHGKDEAELPGALIHDWRGTAFVPGATAQDFERVMRDFADYPKTFAPQVEAVRVLAGDADEHAGEDADRATVTMRVKQQHVITVVLDTTYAITYARADANRGTNWGTIDSRSAGVEEIGGDGRALSAADAHGFLWRMNTYWSYEQRDGGLYIQIESVSLTRSIPTGLGWAVGPFVASVPKESIEFTVRAVMKAMKKTAS
jgi:hypothetical protein